ncbi:MAG: DUF3025 domain-containing protein [Burkholderiales bacterium]|nr:MAG: DUF3025 domain-containing protein [Burkholderiales bacterium]TAG82339.1 MAG: DUF3025 domain-containing protein [Betaproteobacteria bacterium]
MIDSHPAFDFVRPILDQIDRHRLHDSLNALARNRGIDIAFVPPPEQRVSAVEYETRIAKKHELITANSWHDLFNACIWLTFPLTKRAISELHVSLGTGIDNRRPRRRDVLTLFDESGIVLLCNAPLCSKLQRFNEQHDWKALFIDQRLTWREQVRPILFGHGALEQLATEWHRGLTVKAEWLEISPESALDDVDQYMAARVIQADLLREEDRRIPMPLLGVPNWFAENAQPSCYDDSSIFRVKRVRR